MNDSEDLDMLRRSLVAVGAVVGAQPFALVIGGKTVLVTGGNTTEAGQRALLRSVLESLEQRLTRGGVEQLADSEAKS